MRQRREQGKGEEKVNRGREIGYREREGERTGRGRERKEKRGGERERGREKGVISGVNGSSRPD